MIKYSEIVPEDLRQVIRLYERYLNSGAYIRKDIRKAFCSDGYIGYKALDGGKMVGMVSGKKGIAFTYPHPRLEEELGTYTDGRETYTADCLLVLPEYRRMGIARELVCHIRGRMKGAGAGLALAEIWIYPDGTVPAAAAFSQLGKMMFQRSIPQFYQENVLYGIECPVCGENCRCGALIELYLL